MNIIGLESAVIRILAGIFGQIKSEIGLNVVSTYVSYTKETKKVKQSIVIY